MKQSTLLLRACEIWIQKPIYTGFKRGLHASGSSDSVPIAGDCGGGPGSSEPVSTAARRGDGSHCDDAGCERMISIRKPSTPTFISRVNASGV